MEMPWSSRLQPDTNDLDNNHIQDSVSMTKTQPDSLDSTACNAGLEINGKENEEVASVSEEYDDEKLRQRSPGTSNNVRARAANNANKKKTAKKRWITANLSGTRYDVGKWHSC